MTERFDTAYHEERQGRVRAVLIATETWLSSADVAQIDEFLDANDLLAEANVRVDQDIFEDIRALAADMGLSENLVAPLATLDPAHTNPDGPT